MNETTDPLTRMFTGELLALLLFSAVISWPVSKALLALYTRAVRRSMGRRAAIAASAGTAGRSGEPRVAAAPANPLPLHDVSHAPTHPAAVRFQHDLLAAPWKIACVYAAAGCLWAIILTVSFMLTGGLEFFPLRTLLVFWIHVWPLVLTIGIVAASARMVKVVLAVTYFLVLTLLGAASMPMSPDLTWRQVFLFWALMDLPPTILLLPFLARSVRAVGPLVVTFLFVALMGSQVVLSIASGRNDILRIAISVADWVGVGVVATLLGLLGSGFLIFGVFGWFILKLIGRRYSAKAISDESLTIDAIWLLFTVAQSQGLVFERPVWALAGVLAFVTFKTSTWIGFSMLRRRDAILDGAPSLLLLRSFSIGKDSERLFDALEKHWRRVGSIQMIAGADLATRTVEPHEFLDFTAGKVSRRFIDGPEALARRIDEMDTRPDRDLRFRVNDFFCYDDTWRMALSRLVGASDAVLMDLRGFSQANTGCVFELQELAKHVSLDRVVFVVNRRTDEPLLQQSLAGPKDSQTDAARDSPKVRLLRLDGMGWADIKRLSAAIAAAVAAALPPIETAPSLAQRPALRTHV